MAHQVQVNSGHTNIQLPDERHYDGPIAVTLTDEEFDAIRPALFINGTLTDLGEVGGGGGGLSFHRAIESETSYVIPDGSDYFVLAEDWDNAVVLPTAAPGRLVNVACVHVPRFGGGHVYVRRPDSASMNPDIVATQFLVSPGACLTLVSDGTDWFIASQNGVVG
jgi:hypothetical protein